MMMPDDPYEPYWTGPATGAPAEPIVNYPTTPPPPIRSAPAADQGVHAPLSLESKRPSLVALAAVVASSFVLGGLGGYVVHTHRHNVAATPTTPLQNSFLGETNTIVVNGSASPVSQAALARLNAMLPSIQQAQADCRAAR
jgi:hypothetical protein